ncbi:alpha-1,3-mannosyl-glycoprotein 4-beta-N-acetylglucosaminyltransferase C-like [Polyodon spathula]|uniref:alpha-1,3-mannosyl-glycoprotein 4-beta-N-acetylglucosaminyltransferase C-like n=1 Tax=Polyodon spathula TaxID=7913 RepID=UPI001B7E2134|nr:alpha-1,3-mannosyl-glycoprotein 4-beta-N-acetylglucosaminyltransferase C-like [Polyodon spathula]
MLAKCKWYVSKRLQQRYLSVGICSVKRHKENYLMETVQSIFSHLSSSELEEMVLVIYLANFDPTLNTEVAGELNRQFGTHVAAGRLIVISCSKEIYPTLENLKRNYNDPNDRVQYRAKQNVDYALLSNFCSDLSQYHLILEDDVHCSKNFLTLIKRYVARISVSWATIAFSKLGYIGKLYHSEHLPRLARFLLMFYDEMPCDWLLEHFYRSQTQTEIIRYKPSLFQHIGSYSSFQDKRNKLKEEDFQEELNNNPPADTITDIEVSEDHSFQNAYDGNGFFWGKSVTSGNYILVIFKQPVLLKRVHIVTGSPEYKQDILQSGYVEVGWGTTKESGKVTCKNGTRIGDFSEGKLDVDYLNKTITHKVGCLGIQVTKTQLKWILIKQIDIWIANS